ncbi:MAG: helix-turn-helix transcriptional regulator [Bauldia sp.]|nr:helix-turn-helix transcriptional regulator [Bauldia sp.]
MSLPRASQDVPAVDAPALPSGAAHADDAYCWIIGSIISRVGDKWSVFVVRRLAEGTARFSEIRRAIPGVSQRMLTLTLRGLEADGLVGRTVHPTVPPSVEYALSDLGRTLIEPMRVLGEWAFRHRHEVEAARAKFAACLEVDPPRRGVVRGMAAAAAG